MPFQIPSAVCLLHVTYKAKVIYKSATSLQIDVMSGLNLSDAVGKSH